MHFIIMIKADSHWKKNLGGNLELLNTLRIVHELQMKGKSGRKKRIEAGGRVICIHFHIIS